MSAITLPLAIFDIGGPEVLLIMLVALLLFGSQRLPDLARSLGKSIREFKKATAGLEEEFRRAMEAPPPPPPRPPAAATVPTSPPAGAEPSAPANPPPAATPAPPPAPDPDLHSDA
ncbi:MAG TPA: twin-arginine translocase TatA/TatE family subunit [Opitutaceae bacterium]|nr:twin-arginine translocase TatA/TatE family subunit [Opitutaceae bacterium]